MARPDQGPGEQSRVGATDGPGWRLEPSRFERFSQVDDVFSRSWWDDTVQSDHSDRFYATYRRPLDRWRKARGFRRHDYALRNAAWHVADVFAEMYEDGDRRDGFLDPLSMLREPGEPPDEPGSTVAITADLKKVAKTFGADLVGIAEYDPRWVYTERYSSQTGQAKPNDLPEGLTHVIVVGQRMDGDLIATAPSALSGAATGLGYSQDALVLLAIAQYVRNLGYQAVPSMNDTALAIPYAIEAGLGEYGRHGLVITPEFGPNVRFGKIFTNLPLIADRPRSFGVTETCNQCQRCSDACPASAIPADAPSDRRYNRSNLKGVTKWSVDGEACFSYWAKINTDCAVCIRVCPYTRDYSKRHNRWWARLAASPLRKLALALDDRSGRAKRVSATTWWPSDATSTATPPNTAVAVQLAKRPTHDQP